MLVNFSNKWQLDGTDAIKFNVEVHENNSYKLVLHHETLEYTWFTLSWYSNETSFQPCPLFPTASIKNLSGPTLNPMQDC